jgi:class 3 adenylate cyclase
MFRAAALPRRERRRQRGCPRMNAILEAVAPVSSVRTEGPIPLLRTLVLCDLADSTALVGQLGDQRAAELFRRHDRQARSLVHQYGGR